jgi:TonB family protein
VTQHLSESIAGVRKSSNCAAGWHFFVGQKKFPPSWASGANSKSFYERNDGATRVIVFVHGVFGDSESTWTCTKVSWPALLRGDDAFKGSDIYVVGYSTPYLGNQMTIDEVVSNIKNRLDSDQVFSKSIERSCSSFIASAVSSFSGCCLRTAIWRSRYPLFTCTPRLRRAPRSRDLEAFSVRIPRYMKCFFPAIRTTYLLNLESEWRSAAFPIHRYSAYEKQPYNGVLVVDRLSGTRGCEVAIAINENHLTIVKPCDRSADSYIALRNAVIQNPSASEKERLPSEGGRTEDGKNPVKRAVTPETMATNAARVLVPSGVIAGYKLSGDKPVYPNIARTAEIEGTVVLRGVINVDGEVISLNAVSGPPMLYQAAIDAVETWRYKPYILEGRPVSVDTTFQVDFTLNGPAAQ